MATRRVNTRKAKPKKTSSPKRATAGKILVKLPKPAVTHTPDPEKVWHVHPYRTFVEGLPLWLALLTLYMFSAIYLASWTLAVVFTLIIAILVALLFDLLHTLHVHIGWSKEKMAWYDASFKQIGRGLLIGFAAFGLIILALFLYGQNDPQTVGFALGSVFTFVGLGLVSMLVACYVIMIIFLGFPRIRHQLSLSVLLFFWLFYLFLAFAVRRFPL